MSVDDTTSPRRNRFRFRRSPVTPPGSPPPDAPDGAEPVLPAPRRGRGSRAAGWVLLVLLVLAVVGFFVARHVARKFMADSLAKVDGQVVMYGLSAPVTVVRDAHGVPHITAASMDDLIMAQGFV